MVRLLNERSHRRDERINEREIQSIRLLWEEFSQRFLCTLLFCDRGGDGEGGDGSPSHQTLPMQKVNCARASGLQMTRISWKDQCELLTVPRGNGIRCLSSISESKSSPFQIFMSGDPEERINESESLFREEFSQSFLWMIFHAVISGVMGKEGMDFQHSST